MNAGDGELPLFFSLVPFIDDDEDNSTSGAVSPPPAAPTAALPNDGAAEGVPTSSESSGLIAERTAMEHVSSLSSGPAPTPLPTLHAEESAPTTRSRQQDAYAAASFIPYDCSMIKFDKALFQLLTKASQMPRQRAAARGFSFRYDGWRSPEEWLIALTWASPSFSLRRYGFPSIALLLTRCGYAAVSSPLLAGPAGAYSMLSEGQVTPAVGDVMRPVGDAHDLFRVMNIADCETDEVMMRVIVALVQLSRSPAVRVLCGLETRVPSDLPTVPLSELTTLVRRWEDGVALSTASTHAGVDGDGAVLANNAPCSDTTRSLWRGFLASHKLTSPDFASAREVSLEWLTASALEHMARHAPYLEFTESHTTLGESRLGVRQDVVEAVARRSVWLRDTLWVAYATAWGGTTCEDPTDWPRPAHNMNAVVQGNKKSSKPPASGSLTTATQQSEVMPVLTQLAEGVPLRALRDFESDCLATKMASSTKRCFSPLVVDIPRMYGLADGDIEGLYRLCFGAEAVTVRTVRDDEGPRLFVQRQGALSPQWPGHTIRNLPWPRRRDTGTSSSPAPTSSARTSNLRKSSPPRRPPDTMTGSVAAHLPHLDESVELMAMLAVALMMTSQPYLPAQPYGIRGGSDYGGVWFTATWVPVKALEATVRTCYPFIEENHYYGCDCFAGLLAALPYMEVAPRFPQEGPPTGNDASSVMDVKAATKKQRSRGGGASKRRGTSMLAQSAAVDHVRWVYANNVIPSMFFFLRHNARRIACSDGLRQDFFAAARDAGGHAQVSAKVLHTLVNKQLDTLHLLPFNTQYLSDNTFLARFLRPVLLRGDTCDEGADACKVRFGRGVVRAMGECQYTRAFCVRGVVAACEALQLALDAREMHLERRGWLPIAAVEDVWLFMFPSLELEDSWDSPLVSVTTRLPDLFQTMDGMWLSHRFASALSWPASLARYDATELNKPPPFTQEQLEKACEVRMQAHKRSLAHLHPSVIAEKNEACATNMLAAVTFEYNLLYPEEPGIPLDRLQTRFRELTGGQLTNTPVKLLVEMSLFFVTHNVKVPGKGGGAQTIMHVALRNREMLAIGWEIAASLRLA